MGESRALLGRVVAGKFRIEDHVGGGAMGQVFRARHVVLDTAVALKIMRPELAKDAMFKERFYREAKAASRLDHPNSVRVIDFGVEPDGLVYLAMEFLHGRDLLSVLRDEWPLPDERVVDLLVQTLSAVSVAHELGIVHRDLKPENIMVSVGPEDEGTRPYHVKVCDFGIAKLNDPRGFESAGAKPLTSSGTLIGTPEYMSPEQARGDPLDARSDIYSIGIVLYQLLVGKVPFSAENALGVVLKQVTDDPVPPSQVRPGVNPRLEAICLRALQKSRDDRHQTAKEMRRELRAVVGSQPNGITEESGPHLLPAAPQLTHDDVASAATVVEGSDAAASSPVLAAQGQEGDFSPKQTSDGTELTVPIDGTQRWLGAVVAVAVVALAIGAAAVWGFSRGGEAGATAKAAATSGAPSAAPVASASVAQASVTTAPASGSSPLPTANAAAPRALVSGSEAAPRSAGPLPLATASAKAAAPQASTPVAKAAAAPLAAPVAKAAASQVIAPVPSAAPAGPPYNPAGAHVALGALALERVREGVIRAKMAAAVPQLTECYRTALIMVGAPVGGSAEIHMSIDEKGNVTTFVNAPKLPPFARCAQRAIGSRPIPISALETSGTGATASQWLTLHP